MPESFTSVSSIHRLQSPWMAVPLSAPRLVSGVVGSAMVDAGAAVKGPPPAEVAAKGGSPSRMERGAESENGC